MEEKKTEDMKEKKQLLMAQLNQLRFRQPNYPSYVFNIREVIRNSGYDLDWQDEENGNTLLMSLLSNNYRYMRLVNDEEIIYDLHEDVITELMQLGADLNIQDNDGDTALIIACDYYHPEITNSIISQLLQKKADVNIKNKYGKTALFYGYDTEIKQQLLTAGADINTVDNKGQTVLYNDHYLHATLEFLLQSGANPNHQDNDGNTPLIHYCKNMTLTDSKELRINVINRLISAGADVNKKNYEGNTALVYDRYSGEAAALITAGVDINHKNNKGQTALMVKAHTVYPLNHFITLGANVNLRDNEGKTALILLITSTSFGIWSRDSLKGRVLVDLLRGGALVHIRDNEGNTALDYAIQINLPNFVQELLKNQLNIENTEFALHLSEIDKTLPSESKQTESIRDSPYLMENVVSFLDGNKSQKKGKKSRKKKSRQKQKNPQNNH